MTARQPQITPVACADTYLIFDTPIRSQIALPELPLCAGRNATMTVRLEESTPFDDERFVVCHDWRREGGPVICSSARWGAQYRLSFPGRASFHIRPAGTFNPVVGSTISCNLAAGAAEGLIRQLLLNQVIPRYLAHCGELLLHASAVTLPNGKTVAFLGESGQGKSTLASYCHQHGAHLIDDDCILLRFEHGRVSVVGGVPTLRLYPDSLQALGHDIDAFVPCMDYSDKQQLRLAVGSTPPAKPLRMLDALFLLDHPGEAPDSVVRIRPATGRTAMMALLRSAFQLDPSDSGTMTRVFSQSAAVLNEPYGLSVHHLCYPRQHAQLLEVLQAVLDHQQE